MGKGKGQSKAKAKAKAKARARAKAEVKVKAEETPEVKAEETPEVKAEETPEVKAEVSLESLTVREETPEVKAEESETIPVFEVRGLKLGRRQAEAYLTHKTVIETEYAKRAKAVKQSLCGIGEESLIKKTLDLCLMSILSQYVETVTPVTIFTLTDFGSHFDKDFESFESMSEETVRDYVSVMEQRQGVSFSQCLKDLESLRDLKTREKSLRVFLKGLMLHFSGGDHSLAPKKNIDISQSVSSLWSEVKTLV
jgi:hypothetical protein